MDNIVLMTDSYKVSHWKQYPAMTEKVYSYFESRGGEYSHVLFFGLQYILKKYLDGPVVTYEKINAAREIFKAHFGTDEFFNKEGWYDIMKDYNGRLPVEIKAVPEGSIIPTQHVLFTVENTDPKFYWLTSYLETLLEQVWYPCTVATKSYFQKRCIQHWLKVSGSDPADFKLHDFGYRGSTSQESAAIGGAAHLVNFQGSDTLAAITLLQKYYDAKMPAFSIPAAEHSTITAWGKWEETIAYHNMLKQFPKGLVAVVSDSYDIFNACEKIWGEELKKYVEERDGVLIVRPDSGDPATILVQVLDTLGDAFGYTINDQGYKLLPKYLRVIWGDGIDEKSLPKVLHAVVWNKWSADNIAFGSGGGLLQNVTRDTLKFAYKCSNITIEGRDRPVFKDPITDPGKASKSGRFDGLETVFKNGETRVNESLDSIRLRAQKEEVPFEDFIVG